MKRYLLGLALIACVGIAAPAMAESPPDHPDQHASVMYASPAFHATATIDPLSVFESCALAPVDHEVAHLATRLASAVDLIADTRPPEAWPNFIGVASTTAILAYLVGMKAIFRASERSTTILLC